MLRAVLAVMVALALVVAALPAVERARAERTADLLAGQVARLAERATGLAATEAATRGGAARRVVAVTVPSGGFATAPVDYLAVGGVPDRATPADTAAGDVIAYRLRGSPPRVRHVRVDLRVVTGGRVRDDGAALVLRGDARVVLSLVRDGARPRVHVRRSAGGVPRRRRARGPQEVTTGAVA